MLGFNPEDPPPLWRLVWDKVKRDQIPMRASALSYHLLFSLLPSMALILAILSASTFKSSHDHILNKIAEGLVPKPLGLTAEGNKSPEEPGSDGDTEAVLAPLEAHRQMVEQLKTDLQITLGKLSKNVGKISIFSFFLLIFVVGRLFNTIEVSFNAIWNVRSGRPFFNRVAVLSAVVLWGPVLVALSVSLVAKLPQWSLLNAYLIPVWLTTMAFTAFYVIMPYAKVHFRSALLGGLAAALTWELTKVGFLFYLRYAVGMSALYGSLGLVPIIFLWVYITWMVVLAGAQLAYVIQHRQAMVADWIGGERERRMRTEAWDAVNREASLLPYLALATTLEVFRQFHSGEAQGGVQLSTLTQNLRCDSGALNRALDRVLDGKILARVALEGDEENDSNPRFLPANDPRQCQILEVLNACQGAAPDNVGAAWDLARSVIRQFHKDGENDFRGKTLADLIGATTGSKSPETKAPEENLDPPNLPTGPNQTPSKPLAEPLIKELPTN